MRTLYIHAGAHKTASSMLQTALRRDKDLLMKKGLRVIFRSQMINRDLQKCLYRIKNNEINDEVVDILKEDFGKILPKRNVDCLITNEDMFSTIDLYDFYDNVDVSLEIIKSVAEDLGWRVVFVFYTRSQASYIESVYLQHIHLGRAVSFERFLRGKLPEFLSWKVVADKAASVLGEENVDIEPFESIKEKGAKKFYSDFLAKVGVESRDDLDFEETIANARGANRSYSALGIEIANKVNPILSKDEKRLLRTFLQENFSTATHQRAHLLSDKQKNKLMEIYSQANRKLFESYVDKQYSPGVLGYCTEEM